MSQTPQQLIDQSPMSPTQVVVTLLGVFLLALDGFDVIAISFAAPGIAAEWGIDRVALGLVLSMELIGMSIGSILIGGLADKYGRRTVIFFCLFIMAIGMGCSAMAADVITLSVLRFITGIGIGGLLPAVTAIVPEFANAKRKAMLLSFAAAGFSLGSVLGGPIVTALLQDYSWRSIFVFGSIMTFLAIPVVYFLLPESIAYLVQSRRDDALPSINKILTSMRLPSVDQLPVMGGDQAAEKISWLNLFRGKHLIATVGYSLCYLGHMITFYFIIKWTPKVVVDMGFHPSQAGGVLIWSSVGGFSGAMLFGLLSRFFNTKILTLIMLCLSVASVVAFGNVGADIQLLSVCSFFAGISIAAGIAGFYALMGEAFSTDVRASGTGFVIGVGRLGSVVSPIMAGVLFSQNIALGSVANLMALGSMLAIAVLILVMKKQRAEGAVVAGNI